jgi:hypothetical protein
VAGGESGDPVYLLAAFEPVGPLGHEVVSAALFHQPAICHLDAGGPGHQRVGVLGGPEALGVREFLVLVILRAVEHEQAVIEARRRRDPAPADPVGLAGSRR